MINDAGGAGATSEMTDRERELMETVFGDTATRTDRLAPLASAIWRWRLVELRRQGASVPSADEHSAWMFIACAAFVLGFRMGQAEAVK